MEQLPLPWQFRGGYHKNHLPHRRRSAMAKILSMSPFIASLILGLALAVAAMMRGIDRHLARRGRVAPHNMPTIAAFFSITGAVGYPITRYSELHPLATWLIAMASGFAASVGVFWLLAGYIVPAAAKDVEDERYRLQGHPARVTRAIGLDGGGEIEYEEHGVRTTIAAQAISDELVAEGAEVVIERIEDGVAHVELWSRIADELRLPA